MLSYSHTLWGVTWDSHPINSTSGWGPILTTELIADCKQSAYKWEAHAEKAREPEGLRPGRDWASSLGPRVQNLLPGNWAKGVSMGHFAGLHAVHSNAAKLAAEPVWLGARPLRPWSTHSGQVAQTGPWRHSRFQAPP